MFLRRNHFIEKKFNWSFVFILNMKDFVQPTQKGNKTCSCKIDLKFHPNWFKDDFHIHLATLIGQRPIVDIRVKSESDKPWQVLALANTSKLNLRQFSLLNILYLFSFLTYFIILTLIATIHLFQVFRFLSPLVVSCQVNFFSTTNFHHVWHGFFVCFTCQPWSFENLLWIFQEN